MSASLRLLDIQTGSEKEITRNPWTAYTRYNSSTEGGRFLFADQTDGRFEFRALLPTGESQFLRAFPDNTFPPILGLQGNRIAYWVKSEGGVYALPGPSRRGDSQAGPHIPRRCRTAWLEFAGVVAGWPIPRYGALATRDQ